MINIFPLKLVRVRILESEVILLTEINHNKLLDSSNIPRILCISHLKFSLLIRNLEI